VPAHVADYVRPVDRFRQEPGGGGPGPEPEGRW
jgi:hypothetical protein